MAPLAVIVCFALYALGYLLYARYLSRRVFGLRPEVRTPAHFQRVTQNPRLIVRPIPPWKGLTPRTGSLRCARR